jgi:hypothetical protein
MKCFGGNDRAACACPPEQGIDYPEGEPALSIRPRREHPIVIIAGAVDAKGGGGWFSRVVGFSPESFADSQAMVKFHRGHVFATLLPKRNSCESAVW